MGMGNNDGGGGVGGDVVYKGKTEPVLVSVVGLIFQRRNNLCR